MIHHESRMFNILLQIGCVSEACEQHTSCLCIDLYVSTLHYMLFIQRVNSIGTPETRISSIEIRTKG